jgi:CRISPR/Cas system-associated protein Cas10 (large subunit of type III CRISPR-Cas system)
MDSYAPNWTAEEREQYKRDYLAEEPVLQATREHDDDECEHCKLLRQLQREADEQSDKEIPVDYWKVAGALRRAVHELAKHYDYDEEVLVLSLTGELEREYQNLDWSNVMTDSWPLRPEQV